MPQASEELRSQFMGTDEEPTDGIGEAEEIIIKGGGKINKGVIIYIGNDPEVNKAINFLIHEWDYGFMN